MWAWAASIELELDKDHPTRWSETVDALCSTEGPGEYGRGGGSCSKFFWNMNSSTEEEKIIAIN